MTDAVRNSKLVIAVFSEEFFKSKWTMAEVR